MRKTDSFFWNLRNLISTALCWFGFGWASMRWTLSSVNDTSDDIPSHCGSMVFAKSKRGHGPSAPSLSPKSQRFFLLARLSKLSVLTSKWANHFFYTAVSWIRFLFDSTACLTTDRPFSGDLTESETSLIRLSVPGSFELNSVRSALSSVRSHVRSAILAEPVPTICDSVAVLRFLVKISHCLLTGVVDKIVLNSFKVYIKSTIYC